MQDLSGNTDQGAGATQREDKGGKQAGKVATF